MIKNRNGKDLTEDKGIRKGWQEHRRTIQKKGLNDLDNHNVVVTHLEPDILEYSFLFPFRAFLVVLSYFSHSNWASG